jgi:hypothetical protein
MGSDDDHDCLQTGEGDVQLGGPDAVFCPSARYDLIFVG